MSDTVKSWIEERQAVHAASTQGEWAASVADLDDPLDATIIDSDKCQGMWIASSADDTYTAENAYAIADAHNNLPRALGALSKVLELHRRAVDIFEPSEFCAACSTDQRTVEWPCATVQAIEGALTNE